MSILSEIIGSLTGNGKTENVVHPCANCESDCKVYPDACNACKPFKEKLVDALYNVANIDAFYDRYEVVTPGAAVVGTVKCPICGAPTSGVICEYCGSRIGESSGKIQVSSANDIPNPIIEARDIIYARRAVVDKYSGTNDSDLSDILSSVVNALTGKSADTDTATSLGNAMNESEIKAMAEKYGVSVRDYLEGLDMGIYLSKSGYASQQSQQNGVSAASVAGTAAGIGGIGTIAGLVLGNQIGSNNNRPASASSVLQQTVRPYGNQPPMMQNQPHQNIQPGNRPSVAPDRPHQSSQPGNRPPMMQNQPHQNVQQGNRPPMAQDRPHQSAQQGSRPSVAPDRPHQSGQPGNRPSVAPDRPHQSVQQGNRPNAAKQNKPSQGRPAGPQGQHRTPGNGRK